MTSLAGAFRAAISEDNHRIFFGRIEVRGFGQAPEECGPISSLEPDQLRRGQRVFAPIILGFVQRRHERAVGFEQADLGRLIDVGMGVGEEGSVGRNVRRVHTSLFRQALKARAVQTCAIEVALAQVFLRRCKVDRAFRVTKRP